MQYPRGRMPTLRLNPRGTVLDVSKGTRLIDAIRSAGLPIAAACGDELVCAKCGVHVLEGRVTRESRVERDTKHRNRVPAELRLACTIRVNDDLVITADYWGTDS